MERGDTVQLSKRLQTLADLVTPGGRVADVGCDHGFLSIYLVQQGISSRAIAADLREGPLSRAGKHVSERGLEAYIETRLSDGLKGLRPGEADTLVCAGMGGRLMRAILERDRDTARSFQELILQPQSELEEFRAFLRGENYRIIREEILREDGKFYFAMKAVPAGDDAGEALSGQPDARLADRYGGLLLRECHPVLKEYLEFMRDTLEQAEKQIERYSGGGGRTEGRLAQIRSELSDIAEALRFYTEKRGQEDEYGDSDSGRRGKKVPCGNDLRGRGGGISGAV